jgi:hypothetical protein
MNPIEVLAVIFFSLLKWIYKLPLLLFRAVKLISTQKQWKNRIILIALTPLFVVLYPLYKIVVQISLLQNPPVSLTADEKLSMRLFFAQSTVDRIRVSIGKGLIYRVLAAPDWYAFTVGHVIFYLDEELDEDKEIVLRHEIIHTLQYRKYGGRFCYLLLYACHLITSVVRHKFNFARSYEKHPAEVEAFVHEDVRVLQRFVRINRRVMTEHDVSCFRH